MADDLKRELVILFVDWFKQNNVDFWDECNAPEELADIVVELLVKKIDNL